MTNMNVLFDSPEEMVRGAPAPDAAVILAGTEAGRRQREAREVEMFGFTIRQLREDCDAVVITNGIVDRSAAVMLAVDHLSRADHMLSMRLLDQARQATNRARWTMSVYLAQARAEGRNGSGGEPRGREHESGASHGTADSTPKRKGEDGQQSLPPVHQPAALV